MSIKFLAMCIALIGAFFSVFSAELNEVKNWKPIGAIYNSFHVRFCQATCVTFPLFFYI